METLYRLKAAELNDGFLQAVKSLFKDKTIEISIRETEEQGSGKGIGQVISQFREQVTVSDLSPDGTFDDVRDRSEGRESSF